MITVVTNDNCFEFRGLSSDVKPIGINAANHTVNYPIGNGSVFLEMDTGNVYLLSIQIDNETSQTIGKWLEI